MSAIPAWHNHIGNNEQSAALFAKGIAGSGSLSAEELAQFISARDLMTLELPLLKKSGRSVQLEDSSSVEGEFRETTFP